MSYTQFPEPGSTQHSGTQPRRILITGSTGVIGMALCAAARNRWWEAVPVQRERKAEGRREKPAEPGTLFWEPEAAQPFADLEALEGFDAVVHLSGASVAGRRWTAAYRKTILESRTLTTGALALALGRLRNPPPVLITASATGYYGSRGDEELTEESTRGNDFLSEVCELWEGAASPAVAAGIRVVHARFGVVLSPFGGALAQMLPVFRAGLGGRLGDGRQWMSWIGLDDVLAAIFHAIDHTEIAGPLNVVSPRPVRNSDFTHALGRALHRPAIVPAPAFALRTVFGEMADETLLTSCRVLPTKLLESGFTFQHSVLEKTFAALLARTVS